MLHSITPGPTRYIQIVIKSAVIPVAGLGTRLLPATKSQPKEMLPVARKPIVQYVVEELVSNGIRQILFVTGRSKASIENHFDHDPELSHALLEANKQDLLDELDFESLKANLFYTRQRMQKGLGDAVLCAENFAGEEPFLVALGDSILGLNAVSRAVSRMAEVFDARRASCVIAVEEVPREETRHYGIVQPEGLEDDIFRVVNLVEKPAPQDAPSNLAIAGRYIFSPLDLRYDPAREARCARRDPAHRRHPVHVRRGTAGDRGEAHGRREALRYRQFPKLLRELRGIRAGRSRLWRRIPPRAGAPGGEIGRDSLTRTRTFLLALAALLVAARMCHVGILWEGDGYPLAAAGQMLHGKVLYRDIWFDKPPLVALFSLFRTRARGGRCAWQMPSTPCCAAGCATGSRAICGRGRKA